MKKEKLIKLKEENDRLRYDKQAISQEMKNKIDSKNLDDENFINTLREWKEKAKILEKDNIEKEKELKELKERRIPTEDKTLFESNMDMIMEKSLSAIKSFIIVKIYQ